METDDHRPGKRVRKQNIMTNASAFGDIGYTAVGDPEATDNPTLSEALDGPHAKDWANSIYNENVSLMKREVFDVVDLPEGRKALKSRYLLKLKKMAEGRMKFKARLVVLGCGQREGIDYLETFAPVAKGGTIRLLLALAQLLGLHVHLMDLDTAFLYAKLKEEIYMHPPEGMDEILEGKVLKLLKFLYGLKQSPMNFNNTINEFIESMGFKRCVSDHCLYVRWNGKDIMLLVLYVDDIVIAGSDLAEVERVKADFKKRFEMKDLGELRHYLGMTIERNGSESIKVHQADYARTVVKKYQRYLKVGNRHRTTVPMTRDLKLT